MKRIVRWFKNLFLPRRHLRLVFVSEFPEKLKNRKVYIEGDIDLKDFWYAKLMCPCGCGDSLTLNLIDDVSPCWSIVKKDKSKLFSLHPSIRRRSDCKSHFWIIDSKIKWCNG